ncbi:AAA family ATPase [Actinomadura sp. NAK00032]|nr:AAA family ATPase [Actinomadura sp. NAK00032]
MPGVLWRRCTPGYRGPRVGQGAGPSHGRRLPQPATEQLDVELGPVFVTFVLAEEIDRAQVQAALVKVMA